VVIFAPGLPQGRDVRSNQSKYRPDGTFVSGRATKGMDRFSITRAGTELVVDVNAMHKEEQDRAGRGAAVLHL
jgi:hypothetical protein